MTIKDCFFLGTVAKLHGFKGEVSLFLDVSNPSDYQQLTSVFIEIDGALTPFFIEHVKVKNKGFITVKFQDIDNENYAKALLKKSLYLPLNQLVELDEASFYDHEVLGYSVTDIRIGEVGIVSNVVDIKSNPLLVVISNDKKEILIPIFEGLVKKVNRKSKNLLIEAPEGLIELYL
jgi:16S rRNA processing protein RimM